jgi:hypothetical protein
MKKPGKILLIALPALLLGCAGLGLWYMRSGHFQEFVRRSLVSRLETATGLQCRIDRLQLDLFHGRFVISGLELSPRPSAPAGIANLKVQEINASLSISSFWHFRMRLRELNIIKPHLELISGNGESSWEPEDILKNLKLSLRLEASNVAIQDGWLKVNNHEAPFHVSADDLSCEIRYAKEPPSYKIHLAYSRSRLFWEERDILHGLKLDTTVSLQGIQIDSFILECGNTRFLGIGSMKDWKSPVLRMHFSGTWDGHDLILATPTLNEWRGGIGVQADLRYDRDGIYSKGKFTSSTGGYRKMNYSNLAGEYEIRQDVLYLRDVSGRISEGNFQMSGEIQLRRGSKDRNRVLAIAKNVPVIEAGRLLDLPLLNFENTADSNTLLTWHGDQELRVDCDAVLHGMAKPSTGTGRSTLLGGKVKFTYFDSGAVYVEDGNLNSPYTSVRASGGRNSVFRIQLSTTRIVEPFDVIAGFSPPVADILTSDPDLRDMVGEFFFLGDVRIKSSEDVECDGSVSIRNGHWRTYKVDTLSTQASFKPPRLHLRSGSARRGLQSVDGDLDLELGDRDGVSSFGFKGSVRQISLASLKDFGIDSSSMSGSLSGSGSVRFEQNRWQGEGQLSVENGELNGERFDSLRTKLQLKAQQLSVLEAEARRGNARAGADGRVSLDTRQLDMKVRVQGFPIEEAPFLKKRGLQVRGHLGASGALNGTFDSPFFDGTFNLDALRYESWNLGNGGGRIALQNGTVRGNARIRSEFGNLKIQAALDTGKGVTGKTTVEFESLDVQKIFHAKLPPYLEDLSTALEGTLEAEGNFEDLASLRIRGEVDGAHFKIHDHELRNGGRIRFTILNQNFRIESARFVGEGTSLDLSGTVPLGDSPQMDLYLNGNLNLEYLEGIEKRLYTAGDVSLNIHATGSWREPQIIGQSSFHDARLDYRDFPFRFSAMQGDIVFSRNLVRFENVRGSAASGTIALSGIIELQNAMLHSINLGISMRNARLPFPKDFKSVVNAELVLSGSSDVQILSGDVDVTRMEYLRSFNLLDQLASHSVTQSGPLTTEPYLLGLRLNIEVHSDNGLSIDNELTRLRGSMRLALRGTPAYPSLTGRVEASEGTIFFRGSRFQISHAAADFVDRNRINPVLEIRAEADVKTYRLILDAVGDLDHLNLNITSDPAMSTVDILSLLTTGKTESGSGTSQRESQMAGMSAASVLSENLTGVIGKRVQRIFGFESFRVDPFLAGAENDPTARITISERLSKDLVVTFSRNLSTNQEQIVVIEYDIGRDVSVVATRDEDGKFGLDFRLRKRIR